MIGGASHMNILFLSAQALGIVRLLLAIYTMQRKQMENIIVLECTTNLLAAVERALLGSLVGSTVCFVAIAHTILIYLFRKKEQGLPVLLSMLFVSLYTAIPLLTNQGVEGILTLIASVLFAMGIIQERSSAFRLFKLPSVLMWLIYDVIIGAYASIFTDGLAVSSAIVGIVRLDREDWKSAFAKLRKQ